MAVSTPSMYCSLGTSPLDIGRVRSSFCLPLARSSRAVTSSSIRFSSLISIDPLPSTSYVPKSVYTWCGVKRRNYVIAVRVCAVDRVCGGRGAGRRKRASAMGVAGASFLMPRRNCFFEMRPSLLVSHSRKRSSTLWRC